VHGTMQFTAEENNWIKPFIDSENFQRLRHIKQLGLTDWIFPGAVHTRFNHSLGCCYIANQIATKLNLSTEKKQIVIIAALLHDIGHGPFSHLFESLFYKNCIKHEMWTPVFLQEYAKESFLFNFNRLNPHMPLDKNKLLQIEKLITHQLEDDQLLVDMVSSQLDTDRLDYLLRDGHFCGVNYGTYDFRWLLHCLTIVDCKNEKRLGIIKKGVGVVEQYLTARRLMIKNVYQHGRKYGGEYYLQKFLSLLAESLETENLFASVKDFNICKFILKLNAFNVKIEALNSNKVAFKKACNKFIFENFSLYKNCADFDVFYLIRTVAQLNLEHDVVILAKRLYGRILPLAWQVNPKKIAIAKKILADWRSENKKFSSWQVKFLNLPHVSYVKRKDPILVLDGNKSVSNLETHSVIVEAISDISEYAYFILVDFVISQNINVTKLYKQLLVKKILI